MKARMLIPGLNRYWYLEPGTPIFDFRGDEHIFKEATRLPSPGRSAKVLVITNGRPSEYYAEVFPGLEVVPSE